MYLLEKVDACVVQAGGFVLLRVRVERRVLRVRELIEGVIWCWISDERPVRSGLLAALPTWYVSPRWALAASPMWRPWYVCPCVLPASLPRLGKLAKDICLRCHRARVAELQFSVVASSGGVDVLANLNYSR